MEFSPSVAARGQKITSQQPSRCSLVIKVTDVNYMNQYSHLNVVITKAKQ